MYYIDLPIYAQILWIILSLLVLFPWIAIPSIVIYKFIQVRRLPKASIAAGNLEVDTTGLGLTMADGGESIENDKK
jgi:ABC-type microcin C transport system permease subunit YejE